MKGYGLEFDDNNRDECEPVPTNFIALIKNDVCSFLGVHEIDWVGDSTWHLVQVVFVEGAIRVTLDGETTIDTQLGNTDYSFSGVGFGAATGLEVGTYEIDNFRLWVAE